MNRICESEVLKPKLQQLMTCGLFSQVRAKTGAGAGAEVGAGMKVSLWLWP